MASIGKLNVKAKELDIEWRIRDFTSLREENDECYSSPTFHFANASWCLDIYPGGSSDAEEFISLFVCRESYGPPISLEYSIGLQTLDGKKAEEARFTNVFKNKKKCWGCPRFISRSELLDRISELMPSDVLTVTFFCSLTDMNSSKDALDAATAECSYSEENLDSENISPHEQTYTDEPIRCSECSNLVVSKNYCERESQTTATEGDVSLTRDYNKVLLEGKHHDLILKVGDKELRAHQDILSARSRVFESMLSHDMKEKNSGVIDAADCDAQAMEVFLSYIYCGKAEALDQSTMLGLYYIADKYDTQGLKSECSEFIKNSISTTNFCSVIQLALDHNDSDLLEYATEYFMENVTDIMVTVEWQSFLSNNCTVGNELLLKSFRKMKNAKQ